jgi:predicted S18 family serine protease
VLPVGGITSKVLAAHRHGLKRVILPKGNQRDWDEVPAEVRAELEVFFVEHMHDVLRAALVDAMAKVDAAGAKSTDDPKLPENYEFDRDENPYEWKKVPIFTDIACIQDKHVHEVKQVFTMFDEAIKLGKTTIEPPPSSPLVALSSVRISTVPARSSALAPSRKRSPETSSTRPPVDSISTPATGLPEPS